MSWNLTNDVHPLCAQRGHRWELRAESFDAVMEGCFDVWCDRCQCQGTKDNLEGNKEIKRR